MTSPCMNILESKKPKITIPDIGDIVKQENKTIIMALPGSNADYCIIDDEYYFCIGDNFSDAMDSLIFGLVPENSIPGVVSTS